MLFSSTVCYWIVSFFSIALILLRTCCCKSTRKKKPNRKKAKKIDLVFVYHERQIGRLCAQHALNMLLQGRYFTIGNLIAIAHEINQRECALMADEKKIPNGNYDATGNFSIQVITEALRRHNLHLEHLDSPNMLKIRQKPSLAQAYICHYEDHWFILRKIGETWFMLNSLKEGPRVFTELYLELYVTQSYTKGKGRSFYVVEGQLPRCAADYVPEYWQESRDEVGTERTEQFGESNCIESE